jgi:hypothetical protein
VSSVRCVHSGVTVEYARQVAVLTTIILMQFRHLTFVFPSFLLPQLVSMLDRWVVRKPQLSPLEFALLSMSVVAAGAGPLILNGEVTELLAPAAAACK